MGSRGNTVGCETVKGGITWGRGQSVYSKVSEDIREGANDKR